MALAERVRGSFGPINKNKAAAGVAGVAAGARCYSRRTPCFTRLNWCYSCRQGKLKLPESGGGGGICSSGRFPMGRV
jgi:hypothetical protein